MKPKLAAKRYGLRLGVEVAAYFEERSRLTGQSVSAVMAMALTEYCEQKKGLEALSGAVEQARRVDAHAVAGTEPKKRSGQA